jgi:16S rRNA (adenine1518-N6/adenine1519-N6)-dimethyltransferase
VQAFRFRRKLLPHVGLHWNRLPMNRHVPRKRFGQHFLVDRSIVDAIVEAIAPRPGETLVEIGPGLGALTEPLLAKIDRLQVVEIDRDLIAHWQRHRDAARITVHASDALAFDFGSLGSALRIVGNLPYNISTPLLFHLSSFAGQVRDMHFMLQKEVIERMVAAPGEPARGRLSVMLQARYRMDWLLDVPPDAFDPPPKVDSAVVRMLPLPTAERLDHHPAAFARVVAAAFGQRRKMLRNTLRELIDVEALRSTGVDPQARAEELSVAQFEALAGLVAENRADRSA